MCAYTLPKNSKKKKTKKLHCEKRNLDYRLLCRILKNLLETTGLLGILFLSYFIFKNHMFLGLDKVLPPSWHLPYAQLKGNISLPCAQSNYFPPMEEKRQDLVFPDCSPLGRGMYLFNSILICILHRDNALFSQMYFKLLKVMSQFLHRYLSLDRH